MAKSVPPQTNFIARFPIGTVNSILAAQPVQTASIPQPGGPTLDVSHVQLSISGTALHLLGQYSVAVYDAAIDSTWSGNDLSLQSISIKPTLENCQAGDFECIGRNASRTFSSGAAASAYTGANRGKKFRPAGSREKHEVQIGMKTLTLATDVRQATLDGNSIVFYGGAFMWQPGP